MDSLGQYIIGGGIVFYVILRIINAIDAAIMSVVEASAPFGMTWGELVPMLVGAAIGLGIVFVIVGIGINIAYWFEDMFDVRARWAKRRLEMTAHGPIWFDGFAWRMVEAPAPVVVEPAAKPKDRLVPVTQYRNPTTTYKEQWRHAAMAFMSVAQEYGLNRRAFGRVGVSPDAYTVLVKKMSELGIICLNDPKRKNGGYRLVSRNGSAPSMKSVMELESWNGATFDNPPPEIATPALGIGPGHAMTNRQPRRQD